MRLYTGGVLADPRKMPPAVLDHMAEFTSKSGQTAYGFVSRTEGVAGKGCMVLFGVAIVAGIGLAAWTGGEWEPWGPALAGAGLLLGVCLVVFGVHRAMRIRASRLKPAIVATPLIVAECGTDTDPIRMYYLKDLQDAQIVRHLRNGSYQYTAFNLKFAEGSLMFNLSPESRANTMLEFMRGGPKIVQGWLDSGSAAERLAQFDWIGATANVRPEELPRRPPETPLMQSAWMRFGVSAFLALLLTGAATYANAVAEERSLWNFAVLFDNEREYRYYLEDAPFGWHRDEALVLVDDRAYDEADTATKLRDYQKRYPQGRHVEEAREKVRQMYRDAEARYLDQTAAAAGADPKAIEGMKALLAFLRESDQPRVGILFLPAEGIDGAAAEAEARERAGVDAVVPVGPSFTAEMNRAREGRMIDSIQTSFRLLFAQELFDLRPGSLEAPEPRFLIRYEVVGSGETYVHVDAMGNALPDSPVYVGIKILFDFSLQAPGSAHPPDPDPARGFRFSMGVEPPAQFGSGSGVRGEAVYELMVDAAFFSFARALAEAYGLKPLGE